jgi:hypothetical protein
VPTRAIGLLLFLPVPLVLLLFTRAPLGILASLTLGILVMLTHRLYARPWALARAGTRCLWCGAGVAAGAPGAAELPTEDPLGRARWRACGDAHARPVRAVLAWMERRSAYLKLGVLGTLGLFLAWGSAAGLGWGRPPFDDGVAFFRVGIALTVLPLGWLAARTQPEELGELVRSPLPLHVAALVGVRSVLWLFRLVGLLWLVQGALHVAERVGLLG